MDLTRLNATPDHLAILTADGWRPAVGSGVDIDCASTPQGLAVWLVAPAVELLAVRLRWHLAVPEGVRVLPDAWERGYGDLEWRGLVPERACPWYVLLADGDRLHGVGVATGGSAFACWQVDEAGITLELDVRCGGLGVRLGRRRLAAATVVVRPGAAGEDPHAAAHAFCRQLCPAPRLPAEPVYGGNDWYHAYGDNSAAIIRADGALIAELTAGLANRPWMVIDAGWNRQGSNGCPGGPWEPNQRFGDMAALAADLRRQGVRAGLWIRPLLHRRGLPAGWAIDAARHHEADEMVLDPSVPEVLAQTEELLRTITGWGYGLVKHDFSTFDITGRWGFQMGSRVTADGWRLRDDGITTAEAILGLYRAIRRGAGEALVLGCNTVGHLAAGLVEIQRTGDDTSGRFWERTRKMGINTLAMRLPQHGALFAVDADCVGITPAVPWELNRQWLDVLARSGTPLFVSPDQGCLDPEVRAALRAAFAAASQPRPISRALDWQQTVQPVRWLHADGAATYRWQAPDGAWPVVPA
jgi:alpha-galactosidase